FKFYEADVEERFEDLLPRLRLRLYRNDDGRGGRQFRIDGGRIDLLCTDDEDNFVVVEFKKGQAPNEKLVRVLRYMSWIRQHLSNGKDVRGIILTESVDTSLVEIIKEVPRVEIRYYRLNVELLH